MLPLSNHSHTEIEESLLPDISSLQRDDSFINLRDGRRRKIFMVIIICFFLVVTAVVTTGVVYYVYNKERSGQKGIDDEIPTVILISLDGFRWDYLDLYKNNTPVLNKLREEGTNSSILPMFPTKTFPNHYSIVTGLYPDSHGIISNTFYDPVFNATFMISDTSAVRDARWWGGEPIWVTAQKQGLQSGVYFWPGSEAPIDGIFPTHYKVYDKAVPMSDRVEGVKMWLDMPDETRPRFIALYMEPVDTFGHSYGPISPYVGMAAGVVDLAIGDIINHLQLTGKYNKTNLIVVSDHGMAQLSPSRVAYIDQCINLSFVTIVDMSPNCFIIPNNEEDTELLMANLTRCKNESFPHITPYLKKDIPSPLHFNSSRRITPIVVVADVGWTIATQATPASYFEGGNHGYDNRNKEMHGIFIAHGPNIKKGHQVDLVPNIDIYNFISHILHLSPSPNNGSSFLVDHVAV